MPRGHFRKHPVTKQSFYERAGIKDQAKFYGDLYASGELLHPDYFHAIERFHIRWARTFWIYDNVAPGSTLLDVGSGAGLLALLKRKGVRLAAVDLSPKCAAVTQRNGYDLACVADLKSLPFRDQCFDYVTSLDVLGHIEFDEKDAVLAEFRRVLKPEGITMHGIETMNTERRKDYKQMSEDELKRFVGIDGHVGMESEEDTTVRFSRFFSYVQTQPRFSICQSAEELIKQADEYGVALCDGDLLAYLRGLSHNERRAFNVAMGYLFQQISDLGISLPRSEYLFLKASNVPLKKFYNEHADRKELFRSSKNSSINLDVSTAATFDSGWYGAENFPPVGRWMGHRARVTFNVEKPAKLSFRMVTHIPDVAARPLQVELFLNGVFQRSISIAHNESLLVELPLTEPTSEYELEIRADRTWQPRPSDTAARDDREISVAVTEIRLVKD